MTKQIDLCGLLVKIEDYVLIKKSESFPNYEHGSDIDLIVLDKDATKTTIFNYYESNLSHTRSLRVKDNGCHCHVDILIDDHLEIRVDLIQDFTFFTQFEVKPNYISKIFKDRILIKINKHSIYVPSPEDELTLRYFEYLEWFALRPDKIKHINYICKHEDGKVKRKFFETTHRYIQFKRKTWPGAIPAKKEISIIRSTPKSRKEAIITIFNSTYYLTRVTFMQIRALFKIFFTNITPINRHVDNS